MARGRTVRMFLADGTAEGLRILEMSNWTGVALVCGRADWARVAGREEFAKPGVYVLAGERDGAPAIYVGQAETLRYAIDDRLASEHGFTDIIVVVSQTAGIDSTGRRWLASRLVANAKQFARAEVGKPSNLVEPVLDAADLADLEGFLENIVLLIDIAGIHAFGSAGIPSNLDESPLRGNRPMDTPGKTTHAPAIMPYRVVALVAGGVVAEGRYFPNHSLTVHAGAKARAQAVTRLSRTHREKRASLIACGMLRPDGDHLVLTESVNFSSPSMAASVLLGRSCNGLVQWKTADGQTLKDLQAARAGE